MEKDNKQGAAQPAKQTKEKAGSKPAADQKAQNEGATEECMELVLTTLDSDNAIPDSLVFSKKSGKNHKLEVVPSLKKLEGMQKVIVTPSDKPQEFYELTSEGEEYWSKGTPEAQVFALISKDGVPFASVLEKLGEKGEIGINQAMRQKWIKIQAPPADPAQPKEAPKDDKNKKKEKEKNRGTLLRAVESVEDKVQVELKKIKEKIETEPSLASYPAAELDALKKRKLITSTKVVVFSVAKGPEFSHKFEELSTDLTFEMMQSGSWKTAKFKPYNLQAEGKPQEGGYLHPLMKVRTQFREILLEMGFTEMQTSRYVESSFWNFDSLFQPQQHPARDAHDTFFISDPESTTDIPADYLAKVKEMHEKGGHGSVGWRYDWKEKEARKNLLRTHTTAVSAKVLYTLAQEGWKPGKYFSIDRVFRNEKMDATHLCEFHQIEGVVIDKDLSLADLLGVIATFYEKIGLTNLKFKPAYNPYTEPSVEIFCYHPQLGREVEIGNSGVFRPEMLLPMGLPADVRVIAWGLALERPTMILYSVGNIRELFGHKSSLMEANDEKNKEKNRIMKRMCRLDKFKAKSGTEKKPEEEKK